MVTTSTHLTDPRSPLLILAEGVVLYQRKDSRAHPDQGEYPGLSGCPAG